MSGAAQLSNLEPQDLSLQFLPATLLSIGPMVHLRGGSRCTGSGVDVGVGIGSRWEEGGE